MGFCPTTEEGGRTLEVERIITDEAEALAWAENYSEARKVLEEAKPRANEDQRKRIEKFIATIDKVSPQPPKEVEQ
jgi:hypothetical protein